MRKLLFIIKTSVTHDKLQIISRLEFTNLLILNTKMEDIRITKLTMQITNNFPLPSERAHKLLGPYPNCSSDSNR